MESICAQTYSNIEIVLVNDAGCEVSESVEMAKRHCSVKYLRHEDNRGRAAAGNTALQNARGEYGIFVDDDDSILPDYTKNLVNAMNQNPGYGVVYSDSWIVDSPGTGEDARKVRKSLYSWEFDLADLLLMRACFTNSALFNMALAKETLFDERLTDAVDWDFWIRMALKTRFLHLRKAAYEYTINRRKRDWAVVASSAMRTLSKYPRETAEVPIATIAYLLQQRFQREALMGRISEREWDLLRPHWDLGIIPPVDAKDMKVRFIEAKIDDQIPRNELAETVLVLENRGSSILVGGDIMRSVRISYHWIEPEGRVIVWDGERSYLPTSGIMSGKQITMSAQVRAPSAPGRYVLRFAVVQEGVAWFPIGPDGMNHFDKEITVI
jgi:glycosyltransferase involved in cell wall biosynthesis